MVGFMGPLLEHPGLCAHGNRQVEGKAGALAAFHHKTRHWYFKWGLPAILIAQIALGGWLYWHFFLA